MSSIRISAPDTASRDEIVEIKALIRHPMETGYRRGSRGEVIERDIIVRFECVYNGQRVFDADFFPAIAANPFLTFFLRATETGPLLFRWTGQDGEVWEDQRRLTVA